MSVLPFPEAMDSSADLQIWNNAAFDKGEISEDLTENRQSWGSLKSVFANPKASFDSVSDKENQGLASENQVSSLSSLKSSTTPFKTLNTEMIREKSKIKGFSKKGFQENVVMKSEIGKDIRDEKRIDEEIEEIESKISRLNSRLESLRLEKAEKSVKLVEKRGRVISAKFMEPKTNFKNADEKKNIEEIPSLSARTKVQRRGVSLGPAEIFGAAKSKQLSKQETTIMTPLQSRRKSCFWKLQEIDEEKVMAKEKEKSSSLSPKSRKAAAAAKSHFTSRQAVTTITSRKTLKKEDGVINSIQPKKLFKDGEKSIPATNKKPLRAGRVVASRYNQNPSSSQASAMRKRSFPENDKDDRCDKKRSLSVGKTCANENKNSGNESISRVKKRWEIPSEIVVHGSEQSSPVVAVPDLRIRIARCVNESPRDSGPAKKVVELIGRKSFFSNDDDVEVEGSVCQTLTYAEEEQV